MKYLLQFSHFPRSFRSIFQGTGSARQNFKPGVSQQEVKKGIDIQKEKLKEEARLRDQTEVSDARQKEADELTALVINQISDTPIYLEAAEGFRTGFLYGALYDMLFPGKSYTGVSKATTILSKRRALTVLSLLQKFNKKNQVDINKIPLGAYLEAKDGKIYIMDKDENELVFISYKDAPTGYKSRPSIGEGLVASLSGKGGLDEKSVKIVTNFLKDSDVNIATIKGISVKDGEIVLTGEKEKDGETVEEEIFRGKLPAGDEDGIKITDFEVEDLFYPLSLEGHELPTFVDPAKVSEEIEIRALESSGIFPEGVIVKKVEKARRRKGTDKNENPVEFTLDMPNSIDDIRVVAATVDGEKRYTILPGKKSGKEFDFGFPDNLKPNENFEHTASQIKAALEHIKQLKIGKVLPEGFRVLSESVPTGYTDVDKSEKRSAREIVLESPTGEVYRLVESSAGYTLLSEKRDKENPGGIVLDADTNKENFNGEYSEADMKKLLEEIAAKENKEKEKVRANLKKRLAKISAENVTDFTPDIFQEKFRREAKSAVGVTFTLPKATEKYKLIASPAGFTILFEKGEAEVPDLGFRVKYGEYGEDQIGAALRKLAEMKPVYEEDKKSAEKSKKEKKQGKIKAQIENPTKKSHMNERQKRLLKEKKKKKKD